MVVRYDKTHFSFAESRVLGGHLASARRAAGVSVGSLAGRLRVPEQTLASYEAGRARFPLRLLFAAARVLKISPHQLLVGRPDKILNPWGPTLAEWHRVRRGASLAEARPEAEWEADEGGPSVGAGDEQTREGPEDGADSPLVVLTGEEAARAIAFLDEAGPGERLEGRDDEAW